MGMNAIYHVPTALIRRKCLVAVLQQREPPLEEVEGLSKK